MAGLLASYSFGSVVATIGGFRLRGFWEDDDCIMIERNSDEGTPLVGADGFGIISVSADEAVMITLKFLPSSPSNLLLETRRQQTILGGNGQFSISIRDLGTQEGGSAAQCVVTRSPNVSFGKNATAREWKLFANPWVLNTATFL